jgi:hypothetical protein
VRVGHVFPHRVIVVSGGSWWAVGSPMNRLHAAHAATT